MTVPPPAEIRRLVYIGTPAIAVPPLLALHEAGFEISLVVTKGDRRRERRGRAVPSPVKDAALALGLPVTSDVTEVVDIGADLGVVVAFGEMIPASVLDEVAMVNIHFSLLPRWRGAAPLERAILAGDEETGVCLMAVEETLDTGGVYRSESVPIGPEETLEELRDRLVQIGTRQLVDALREGLGEARPQTGRPTYASKISAGDLRLDWNRTAVELHRVVRLGRAWTTFRGRRLRVLDASPVSEGPQPGRLGGLVVGTAEGGLLLRVVQPEGKTRQSAQAWLNGARPGPDDRFGE